MIQGGSGSSADGAMQVAPTVKEYRLAYEVRTIEGVAASPGGVEAWMHHVDALSGSLLSSTRLAASDVGLGNGNFNRSVPLQTTNIGKFILMDFLRNYSTRDAWHDLFSGPNVDANDVWGDGMPLQGLVGSGDANRQSAMVDGHFGAQVYWDLMNNVFGRRGPDGNGTGVNILVHYGFNWDEAEYSSALGEVHLGDGAMMQALEVVGHELGHALNHFTADTAGIEGLGLNESNSDIWGAMTRFYLVGGGFTLQSKFIPEIDPSAIPGTDGPWLLAGRRNMRKPTAATGIADYWSPPLDYILDEHKRGEPNNRAFFFLAKGSSLFMNTTSGSDSFSALLPFGMAGVGTNTAALIWHDALVNWMPHGIQATYLAARNACIMAATARFGVDSKQVEAVMNAYAGIGVGMPAPSYPSAAIAKTGPNATPQEAMQLPSPGVVKLLPRNITVTSGSAGSEWYTLSVLPGQAVSVGVAVTTYAFVPETYEIEVFDSSMNPVGKKVQSTSFTFSAFGWTAGGGAPVQKYFIKVTPTVSTGFGIYKLAVQYWPNA
jgi:hypothetical protein